MAATVVLYEGARSCQLPVHQFDVRHTVRLQAVVAKYENAGWTSQLSTDTRTDAVVSTSSINLIEEKKQELLPALKYRRYTS